MFIISENPPSEFADFLDGNGIERYRARQILHWIYKKLKLDFSDFNNLPKKVLDFLKDNCLILSGRTVHETVSKVDNTAKFLIELGDKNLVESALIYAPDDRLTACLSTQVGCLVSCSFCASGKAGFKRNLTTSEMVTQYLLMQQYALHNKVDIKNIVFMGIGEPLFNYDNLLAAIEIFVGPETADISARRITISTAGIVPAIEKLSDYKKQVNLSISLHSGFDKKRNLLVPINKKYNIKTLVDAVRKYIEKTGRMVTFEYVLIKGLNDTVDDAVEAAKILKGLHCKVNLIPYNPINSLDFKTSSNKDIKCFTDILAKNKIKVLQRYRKGVDIDSGCGQLKAKWVS